MAVKDTNKRIMITISKEEFEILEKISEKESRKPTNLATYIIRNWINDHKDDFNK
ncbi:hypothetical protein [Clostridium beijerinckii]|nr:hypothetical protein [Clostridium beijerinckii]NSB17465.1 hypothetical protein [Clostridium beijerinckii]OOM28424.1 hypothetical protein CLOBE_26800 [Clostridium beijerinckii]